MLDILKKYWGYTSFRPLQSEIIDAVCKGRDVVALMPTGGGKSLTYQIPALMKPGLCIVVTPLIALMKDQVDALRRRGILAAWVHSAMSRGDMDRVLDNCVYGDYKFLYVSPERLESDMFRIRLMKMHVNLVAVDEAHCISEWGYDFRPAYLKIKQIREFVPNVPVIALTASATESVVGEIVEHLNMHNPQIFRMSFRRENISYLVRRSEDKLGSLLRIINAVRGSGIVYVRTRKRTEEIAQFLTDHGISALHYHGGMVSAIRSKHQEQWLSGACRVIVATNAFGMGIDKADVRFVIHADMCDSLEAYYQEAGRCGRDGLPAYAVLLSSDTDMLSSQKRVALEFPPIATIKTIYDQIFQYFMISYGDGKDRSVVFNIYEFATKYRYFVPMVINAIKILNLGGYMTLIDEMENPTRIMFVVNRDDLYKVKIADPDIDVFLSALLRICPGVFSDFVSISESYLASLLNVDIRQVSEHLITLSRAGVIKYIPGAKSPVLVFNEERLPPENLYISPQSYSRRKEVAELRGKAMFDYALKIKGCRSLVLQNHFGDMSSESCGRCDLCRGRQGSTEDLHGRILTLLGQGAYSVRGLADALKCNPQLLVDTMKLMFEDEEIVQRKDGTIHLK